MADSVQKLLDRLAAGELPSLTESVALLEATGADEELIYARAAALTRQHHGDLIYLRGVIEFSNFCTNRCHYCGIRAPSRTVNRYRMTPEEILETARKIQAARCGTVVLQSGVDPYYSAERLAELIRRIKSETALAVTLSIGTKTYAELALLKEAGADRCLLRFETSDRQLFSTIHPDESFEERIECIRNIRRLGYQTGSGFMIGLPGTSTTTIARDLLFAIGLDLDMIGCGPFVPGAETPLAEYSSIGDHSICYKTIALLRITNPLAHIPAATAFDALTRGGRDRVLRCGANVFMPNFTPAQYRDDYKLYARKPQVDASVDIYEAVSARIRRLGRSVSSASGHALRVKHKPHCGLPEKGPMMNQITVNGKEYALEGCSTLTELFGKLAIRPEQMAVELNGEIIPGHALATTAIQAGDRMEIIQFVGGG